MDLEKISVNPSTLEEAKACIAQLVQLVLAQQVQIETQQKEIDALKAEVETLRESVANGRRSSRNSHNPPSSDSPEQRARRPKKKPSSRSKGAQPGHPKHERTLLPGEQVDQTHRYFPDARCHCGGELVMQTQPSYRHQVFELPEVKFQVTEHQLYKGCCSACDAQHTAAWPDSIPSGQMDAGLISTIVLLSGQFHLSMRQIQTYLKQIWQLDFSVGAISQAQGKANQWMGDVYRDIGEHVRQSEVAYADETRHFRGSEQRWLWTLVTTSACFFMVHYSRGKMAARELLSGFKGYLITDHYSGYNDYPHDRRQLCWAHLIRHFQQISERKGQCGDVGKRLLLIAHVLFKTCHQYRHDPDQRWRYRRRIKRLRESFRRTLIVGSELGHLEPKGRTANQCRHLLKDEQMCWTFLNHPAIGLTNNEAERAERPYVIWRKLSFASQSHQGDQFRPMVLSIVTTAKLLQVNTAKFLREICNQGIRDGTVTVRLPLRGALPAPATDTPR